MALAFTQLEYPHIMSCETYGDIGRDALLDPKLLVHVANSQEIVTSSRIEDLRAYHRLELASGIALSNDRTFATADDGDPPLSIESAKKRKHPMSNRKITSRYGNIRPHVAQFKLITSPSDASVASRPRHFSDTTYRHTFSERNSALYREARSKSTADGLRAHRASLSNAPDPSPPSEDVTRPPLFSHGIFKKIEQWTNKTLKQSRRHSTLNFDFFGSALAGQASFLSAPRGASAGIVGWDSGMMPPPSSRAAAPQASPEHCHVTTPDAAIMDFPPYVAESHPPSPTTAEVSFAVVTAPLPASPASSESLVKRIVSSHSTPSLVSLDKSYHDDSGDSVDGGSFDDADDSSRRHRLRSTSSSVVRPPRHQRDPKKPSSVALMAIPDDLAPPDMRRHTSMPARSRTKHPHGPSSNLAQLNLDNARLIRERAHVVSYLQRKASDVSSLNSPVDSDEYRDSLSSDEGTRRAHRATNRTNSFSFLGSLSVDLERSLLLEEKEQE
ncbi:hypothetical protein DYB38_005393 [Aphanomyces astaci]|uniref:Uncharacterized protein n=1 Tax=Aphanomyces astaci TaxID=112090 RepID=A0A397DQ94_APHAT|nr:hypothetical protein DYB38_005393 [Aphanomyces astaci]